MFLNFVRCLLIGSLFVSFAWAEPVVSRNMDGDDFAWYFNKPGIDIASYEADIGKCRRRLALTYSYNPKSPSPQGLLPALHWMAIAPGIENADFSNCMIVAGYRRIDVLEEKQRSFQERMSLFTDEELLKYVSSRSPPVGFVGQFWGNDVLVETPETPFAAGSLDYIEPDQILPEYPRAAAPGYLKRKSLDLLSLGDSIDSNLATVVFSLEFQGKKTGFDSPYLVFARRDPETGNMPMTSHNPTMFRIANLPDKKTSDGYQVAQIPPGQYALWIYQGMGGTKIQFCFETIAFEVVAGDIVYLGDWMSAPKERKLTLDLNDMASARVALAGFDPQLAEKMVAVEFRNGATLPCSITVVNTAYGIRLPTE